MIRELRDGAAGRLIEVRAGFHHASDLDLSKPINWKRRIATERPGSDGSPEPCETWDNATLLCEAEHDGHAFPLVFETKRMMPGATNSWFLEVYGMKRSYRYSTSEPRTLYTCENTGRTQAWSRLDLGYEGEFAAITGGIFEFGFPDAIQQMWASFMLERAGALGDRFATARPEELALSHRVMTAALRSHAERRAVAPDEV